jgi:ArsR family transcriptional regulator
VNTPTSDTDDLTRQDAVFRTVAGLFSLLSTPIRLKIISSVCQQEKNVSELLAEIETTQPNMSQHLATLHRAGVLGRRREGTQIYYRLQNEQVATLCRAVCTQVALDLADDDEAGMDGGRGDAASRLAPPTLRG